MVRKKTQIVRWKKHKWCGEKTQMVRKKGKKHTIDSDVFLRYSRYCEVIP